MGGREACWVVDSPGGGLCHHARHSRSAGDGLRGQRAASPAGGGVDRLRPRRRPGRRVRRARRTPPGTRGSSRPTAARSQGRLVEPHGVGFALLIAPAYAIGGARAVQGEMLALLAFAFVLGAALARRMVPEPWATVGVGLVGLSPPALAAATTITPGVPAAVLLSAAALCALAIRENPRRRYVLIGALCLAALPWLGWTFLAAGAIVAWALVAWTLRERRRLGGAGRGRGAGRVPGLLRDGQRPLLRRASRRARRAARRLPDLPLGYVERIPRLAGLWLDRDVGLLRWAPLLGLVFFAALAVVLLPARPARARRPRPPRGGGVRGAAAGGGGRAAGRRRAADDGRAARVDVPGRAAGRVLPGGGRADRVGPAARAAASWVRSWRCSRSARAPGC